MPGLSVGSRNRTLHLDIKEVDLNDLSIGDEVVVEATGVVRSVSAPYEHEDEKGKTKKEEYGDVSIRVKKMSITGSNEFTDLAEAED